MSNAACPPPAVGIAWPLPLSYRLLRSRRWCGWYVVIYSGATAVQSCGWWSDNELDHAERWARAAVADYSRGP